MPLASLYTLLQAKLFWPLFSLVGTVASAIVFGSGYWAWGTILLASNLFFHINTLISLAHPVKTE